MPARKLDLDRVWTLEEVLALPDDGNRYELVDGELLVSPAPRLLHQVAVGELIALIRAYVMAHQLGRVLSSPADLELRARQRVQPDIFVVPFEDGRLAREWSDVGIPSLVVEVLSPSTAHFDREKKRKRYQKSGVPVYWIVDLDRRHVETWTPDAIAPVLESERVTWQPAPDQPPFTIELPTFFDGLLAGR